MFFLIISVTIYISTYLFNYTSNSNIFSMGIIIILFLTFDAGISKQIELWFLNYKSKFYQPQWVFRTPPWSWLLVNNGSGVRQLTGLDKILSDLSANMSVLFIPIQINGQSGQKKNGKNFVQAGGLSFPCRGLGPKSSTTSEFFFNFFKSFLKKKLPFIQEKFENPSSKNSG